jgi:hypothetical protein
LGFLSSINHYRRVTAGMCAYMRTPLNPNPLAMLHEQMENRAQRWLAMVQVGAFERSDSVYGQLIEIAGCSLDDLRTAVRWDGLGPTLDMLRDNGVYVTHDEFKGKVPIERSGQVVDTAGRTFANPLVSGWLDTRSSGSRSSDTKSSHNTALTIHREANWALHFAELGIRDGVSFPVRPVLPPAAGIVTVLAYARQGCTMERWFALGGSIGQSAHYRALTNYIVGLARWNLLHIPFPEHLPAGEFSPVAKALAEAKRRGQRGVLQAVASIGVKVVEAALSNGWDIGGSLFISGGEPVTAAKRRYVESAGVSVHIMYWISEVGPIGWSCSQNPGDDTIHLMRDSLAVRQHSHQDRLSSTEVRPLLFTTLLPKSANLLINADMGDCATLRTADYSCRYS